MNKPILVVAGVLAIIGLIVNLAYDLDNIYHMTTVTIWVVTGYSSTSGCTRAERSSRNLNSKANNQKPSSTTPLNETHHRMLLHVEKGHRRSG